MLRLGFLALFLIAGCSQGGGTGHESKKSEQKTVTADKGNRDAKSMAGKSAAPNTAKSQSTRKIIYTANIELAVEDFSDIPTKVKELVDQYGGYIASNTLSAESGSNRNGRWTLRIPVDHFDAFMGDAKSLGQIVNYGTNSREVTEEYYDIQARVKNKQLERDRLQTLLNNDAHVAKLKDVLVVEHELSRVQGEIERFQGRTRQLDNLTALTTVHLTIRQIPNYSPPEVATFGTIAKRTFLDSWKTLQSLGQAVLLAIIALAPWLPLIAIALCLLRFGWKRLRPIPRSSVS